MYYIAVDKIDTYDEGKLSVSLLVNASTPDGNDVARLIKSSYDNHTGKDISFQTESRRVKGVMIDYKATPNYRGKDEDFVLIELVLGMIEITDAPRCSHFDVPLTIKKQREIIDDRFEQRVDEMLVEESEEHDIEVKIIEKKPIYYRVAKMVAKLVEEKDKLYGNSIENCGKILKILYPNGVKPEQYKDMLLVMRILEEASRVANKKEGFEENPFMYISGYALLGAIGEKE